MMIPIKNSLVCNIGGVLLIVTVMFIAGCGYNIGSIAHPQLKSIAIAPVQNNTYEPDLSALMRQALAENFQMDNSLKVKSEKEADCVLYGRIIEISTDGTDKRTTNNEQIYRTAEFTVDVTFEFVVIIPGRATPVVGTRQVVGSSYYQVTADQFMSKKGGLAQACRDAAKQAVNYTVEAW